ncbi:MAG: hypothetical protein O3A53_09915 [Acidobacteria bacterium]|nr:hypothetical protein [Acidobacteriota bacterium]MDA1235108.1 hypothetical protein [Acidobacteriota bacterium]
MNTKEAVALAKRTVAELFAEDKPTHIALEEIDRNDSRDEWLVTIGFSREWGEDTLLPAVLLPNRKRVYKVVRVVGGEFKSVKNRELTVA